MKTISRAVLLAAAAALGLGAMGATPALAQKKKDKKEEPAGPKLSKEVQPLAYEAQQLLQAGDSAGAKAKIDQALPLAQTPDDKYILGSLLVEAGSRAKNIDLQRQGIELALESGAVPAADVAKYTYYSGNFAYSKGEFAKAVTQLKAAKAAGYVDRELPVLLAQAYFKSNQPAEGLASLKEAVQASSAAGQKPDENWIRVGLGEAYKSKQPAETAWWSQELVKAYPTPKNWRDTLMIYRDGSQLDAQTDLDVLRLMRATKSLTGQADFAEYAQRADDRGLPGEVKAVIDEGRASGAIANEPASIKEIYTLATGKVKADRASLVADEKAAGAAKDGKTASATADGYLGYGEYAKAVTLYQLALTKGGVDANTVNTRLGIALAMSGNKPAAQEAFAKVTGARQGVADYWELYLDQTA